MSKVIVAALVAGTLVLMAPAAQAAQLSGHYTGTGVLKGCTYTNCARIDPRSIRLSWRFTPTQTGASLHSYTGNYTLGMRFVPGRFYYVGRKPVGHPRHHWVFVYKVHAVIRRRIGGVMTVTKVLGSIASHRLGAPRYHDLYAITLRRHRS